MKVHAVMIAAATLSLATPAAAQQAYVPYAPSDFGNIPGMQLGMPATPAEQQAERLRVSQLVMARVEALCRSTAHADQQLCARARAVIQKASARYDAEHSAKPARN